MQPSETCIELVKHFEGFRSVAYICPAGIPTIGYGHTKGVTHSDVGIKFITEDTADQMLADDLAGFAVQVGDMVSVELSQNQFDALCSFVFNLGAGALQKSTLLEKLNAGEYDAVPNQLMRWTHADGEELPGLVARRTAEAKLWSTGDWQ